MWFFFSKKQIKKELKKIAKSFKKADEDIKELRKDVVSKETILLLIENAILKERSALIPISPKSPQIPTIPTKSQDSIETRVFNRIKRNKKAIVFAEINKLSPSSSVVEMYNVIVLEKKLCSKSSFYRYIETMKSQVSQVPDILLERETELRQIGIKQDGT